MDHLFTIVLPLFLLLLLVSAVDLVHGGCNRDETVEAEKSFKNCVESAQTGIIAQAAKQERQAGLCSAIENMLSVCQRQTDVLAGCKGSEHAEKVKRLHLSATADIVHSLNRRVNVEECSVFTVKTAIPADTRHNNNNNYGDDDDGHPRSEPHASSNGTSLVSSVFVPLWTVLFFFFFGLWVSRSGQ